MTHRRRDLSEEAFQEKLVKELTKYQWSAPDYLNGNKQEVTVNDLVNNWRKELNRINADQLEGVALTDAEFKQVLAKVSQIDNSYEAAKILAMESSTGKIDGIYRDDHPKVTRKQITLTIFKKAAVRGGDSNYQVAREVSTLNGNRFDIVLLINGLPLINIEQKRADKTLDEAFCQFKRYYREGEYSNNFMAFSQMMVIMSDVATRYFATPKSLSDFNLSFVFGWADKHNRPINKWEDVVKYFLKIPMAHQLVGDYLIIDEALEEENRRHMIMRPYQVYALQAVEGAAMGWDNDDGIPHGGFVWHTTGSGKTITSFKTALFLSTRGGFDKVIFLVDRRELDSRTSDNFKAYAVYESVSVDDTKHTYELKKQLLESKKGIIVTTTFKLNSLVKEMMENQDRSLAEQKHVFIIDEAHRTTMGDMMGTIKAYFKKNGLFYGFTGTPLFEQNKATGKINEKSELIDTTEKLFGPELHRYTIDEAIGDGNVLGFHVDYINTGEFISHDDLREKLIEKLEEESPHTSLRTIERRVHEWSKAEVEKQAVEQKLLVYQDETHIPRVVEEILKNWESQSQSKIFNGILTVAYKERVTAYYREFKKQLSKSDYKINTAMTFSFGNENEIDDDSLKMIRMMFKDYGEFTGIEFSYKDIKRGEKAYFEDLVARAARGGSGRNNKNIDLVIVADQLLTGYDSRYLNALYVDRHLELQNLIQAYSRTNRVYGKEKEFGAIINFKYPSITEELVNEALKLYGSGGESSKAIVEHYEVAVDQFASKAKKMLLTLSEPSDWELLNRDNQGKESFITAFKDARDQLRRVMQYYEYEWDVNTFGIDEYTWLKYQGSYKNLSFSDNLDDDQVSIIPLVGKTKLSGTQVIDSKHILSLIGSKVKSSKGVQTVDRETLRIIHEQIQELSDMGEHEQAKMLKEFVDTELVAGNLPSDLTFDEAYGVWKGKLMKDEIERFAIEFGVSQSLLYKSLANFSLTQVDVIPYIDEISQSIDFKLAENKSAGSHLYHNINFVTKELPEWLIEIKKRFD